MFFKILITINIGSFYHYLKTHVYKCFFRFETRSIFKQSCSITVCRYCIFRFQSAFTNFFLKLFANTVFITAKTFCIELDKIDFVFERKQCRPVIRTMDTQSKILFNFYFFKTYIFNVMIIKMKTLRTLIIYSKINIIIVKTQFINL